MREMPIYLYLWQLLALCTLGVGFIGCPANASEPSGILPYSEPPEGNSLPNSVTSDQNEVDIGELSAKNGFTAAVRKDNKVDRRFGSMRIMEDLLQFRQSSADGLVELQYLEYLTHALMLSRLEMTAHDLMQMPLHRFSSPLSPDQIAEVPLESVGGPRPYHMFVLFTFIGGRTDDIAQELSNKCRDCSAALAAFREVSRAYKLSDSSPGNEDVLPVFFAVVNIGTRDGAGISAIHPAMQVPIVMHLPPTAFHGFCSNRGSQDPRCSAAAALSDARALSENLSAVRNRIVTAEFFSGALNDGWDGDEDDKLQKLFQQQVRDKIRGKFHFFSPSQSQLFLLQRFKNEAPAEQRLLEWANLRTKRKVNYAQEDYQVHGQKMRSFILILFPLLLLFMYWLFLKGLSLLRRNQWVVPAGGVVAYTLCSGGLIFSVIHSVPFAGYDEANRRYVLLAPTSRAQFMLEGLILASCSTVASLAALLLVRFPGTSEQVGRGPLACLGGNASINETRTGKSSEGLLHCEGYARWQRLLAAASFAVTALIFVLCSGFVMQCYRTKAAWYSPVFWPSPLLPKGPLRVDWGNAF